MSSEKETKIQIDNIKDRIKDLISKMTLKEKADLLAGKDNWHTAHIERLGIPSLVATDGPHGVRRVARGERAGGPSTYFPTGISMASSWNTELMEKIGTAIGEETRAIDCDILLGPCVNIVRHPLAGRNFECYSEDPYLAGKIGAAFVKGIQSCKVAASLKHFACNNQEIERLRINSVIDERTLREIYLTAFEIIVKEAEPWTVMCSYNRINGIFASENLKLLHQILREEWGYEGMVVSDWGANHSTVESVEAGMDLEMPGPAKYYGKLLVDAVNDWKVDISVVDRSVARILRTVMLTGKMDNPESMPKGSLNTPEHQKLSRQLAEESITLLKNENNLLPLKKDSIKSIAVIGPNAAAPVGGDGSSKIEPPYYVTPLDALRVCVGDWIDIKYEKGCENMVNPPVIKSEYLTPPKGDKEGVWGEYFDNAEFLGEPVLKRIDRRLNYWIFDNNFDEISTSKRSSARWTGKLKVPDTGRYLAKFIHTAKCKLYIDGKCVLKSSRQAENADSVTISSAAYVELVGGKSHDFCLEFVKTESERHSILQFHLGYDPIPEGDTRIERAVELAKNSDVAVIFAGMMEDYETEGFDRDDIEMPGRQNELISAVVKANPNTIVVLNTCSPVTMPWIDEVPAVIEAFYFGQEGGNAIANVLMGKVNPSGKLSMTFPKRLQDTPAYLYYPGTKDIHYGEGVFVGYRYYDKREVEPLFPFGFGLSYTTFEYGDIKVAKEFKSNEPLEVALTIKNTGDIQGKEVMQVYINDKKSSVQRPPKELKAFRKIDLNPGDSEEVKFSLDKRAFSFYDAHQQCWVAEPGEFEILIGSSSRDIRSKATVKLLG